jgi:hypothetical protein
MEYNDAKKYNFHYDFACKKVPLSLGYAKQIMKNVTLKCIPIYSYFISEVNPVFDTIHLKEIVFIFVNVNKVLIFSRYIFIKN